MTEAINVNLYGDGSRNSKLRAEYIFCEYADSCSLCKSGKCFNVTVPFGRRCKLGQVNCIDGGTRNTKKYNRVWHDAKASPVYHKLEYPLHDLIAQVDDKVMLSVHYINIETESDTLKVKDPGFGGGYPATIPEDMLSVENIHKIVTFRPQALMGGTIRDYQSKTVPMFLYQLSMIYPEQYQEYITAHPEKADIRPNWVGRWAKLATCSRKAEYKDNNGSVWRFDGDYIVCEKRCSAFNPFTTKPVEMRVKVIDDMTVQISDNEQVLPETEFS